MSTLEEALDAAMVADPDGGPWETALADALTTALDLWAALGGGADAVTAILEEYRAAVARLTEDGEA